jgi:hypothetical protein
MNEIVDADGNFLSMDLLLPGSAVRDARTEVNDELSENTAFFGQTAPDTGVDEMGVVFAHAGFNPVGSGGILDAPQFEAADFTQPGHQIARIEVRSLGAVDVDLDGEGIVGGSDLGLLLGL